MLYGVSVHKNGEKITSRKVRWHPPCPKHKLGIAPCSVSSLMVSVLQLFKVTVTNGLSGAMVGMEGGHTFGGLTRR